MERTRSMEIEIILPELKCERCGHTWNPRVKVPKVCPNPKCKTPYWDRPRKVKNEQPS